MSDQPSPPPTQAPSRVKLFRLGGIATAAGLGVGLLMSFVGSLITAGGGPAGVSAQSIGALSGAIVGLATITIGLLKVFPERQKIVIDTTVGGASTLVIASTSLMDRMQAQLDWQGEEIKALRSEVQMLQGQAEEADHLKRELVLMTEERDQLHEANEALHIERRTWKAEKVDLERQVAELRTRIAELERQVNGSGAT